MIDMKKFLLLVLLTILLTGCGVDKTVKIGTIKYMNVSEEMPIKSYDQKQNGKQYEQIFFDNLYTMVAALQVGQIDEFATYECVEDYLVKQNPAFECIKLENAPVDLFCCAMREEDAALMDEFNVAMKKLIEDGTMSQFVKTYMQVTSHGKNLPEVELPAFYGKPMIKIGVTGDLPMLDYIRPDGTPTGFNTAILAELSKLIGKNFLLVQVDSGSRAVALKSGKVDLIFWAVVPKGGTNRPADFDKPEGVILSVPYFSNEIVHVRLRK